MIIHKDGSATVDEWDIKSLFELGTGTWCDKEVNDMRYRITRTLFHRIWYSIKYPRSLK